MSNTAKATQSQSSYVDSYVPPSGTPSTVPAQQATPTINVQTPVMAQPTQHNLGQNNNMNNSASTLAFKSNDPLKKLEELVSKFENNKDNKKTEQLKEIKTLQKKKGLDKSSHPNKAKDPLGELERALDAYEKKHKEKVAANKENTISNKKIVDKVASQKPVAKPFVKQNDSIQSAPSQKAEDPLDELEKALDSYEKKYKEKVAANKANSGVNKIAPQQSSHQDSVKQNDSIQSMPSQKAKDPLAELERALDDYERSHVHKGKKDQQESSVNSQTGSTPVSAPVKKSQTEAPIENKVAPSKEESGESIEEQNIFELLGVNDASDKEKEEFLDELQQALWEDFLDKDVSLLVTESEAGEITKIRQDNSLSKDDQQNALIQKIEQFIPDIEEIMLEKALELKEDMVWERVNGVREHLKNNNQSDEQLSKAETHLKDGRWKTGTQLLNKI